MAKQVYNDVMPYMKSLKSLLNTEDKYIDAMSSEGVGTTWELNLLNGVLQDDTENGRIGISLKASLLELNLTIAFNSTNTTQQFVRFLVVRDEQPNEAAPTAANYFTSTSNIRSPTNPTYCKRFYTYVDEIVGLDPYNRTFVHRSTHDLGFHVSFDLDDSGLVADITKNALYLFLFSTDDTNQPTVSFYTRFWFVDN
jgi:hypothetical protein